jgi:hypothetical protein
LRESKHDEKTHFLNEKSDHTKTHDGQTQLSFHLATQHTLWYATRKIGNDQPKK